MVIHFSGLYLYIFLLIYLFIAIFLIIGRKKNLTYIFFFSIMYVYIYYLIKTTQFPIYIDDIQRETFGGQNVWREMNYIPFSNGFSQTSILNIIMTIPLGLGVPFLIKANVKKIFLIALITTLLIELGQLLSALYAGYTFRYIDIDDVILNVTGALIGYLLLFKSFKMLYRYILRKSDISGSENFILKHMTLYTDN